jgi:ankyrin repeat protein
MISSLIFPHYILITWHVGENVNKNMCIKIILNNNNKTDVSALMMACDKGQWEVAELLLDMGADPFMVR